MATEKSSKYMTKTTSFGGSALILYSIDGVTWSTRKDELDRIKERQEKERILLDPTKAEDDKLAEAELDKEIVLDPDDADDIAIESEDEDSAPKKRGRKPGSKIAKVTKAAPAKAKKIEKKAKAKKPTGKSKKAKKKK